MEVAEAPAVEGASSEGPSQERRVALKENSIEFALPILRQMGERLQGFTVDSGFDAKDWLSSLNDIVHDHENFEFFTGLAGDTGMGKTSLLNAVLYSSGDIAPSSQHGACTAAICCFKYHQPREGAKFKAKIRFKPKSVVDVEVSRFLQDKEALEKEEEEEDGVTRAERQSLNAELARICSWSGLSSDRVLTLGASIASAITSNCKRSHIFFDQDDPDQSVEIQFSHSTITAFSQELRKYVSSAGARSRSEVYWPIVELAYIYLPSDLLGQCPGLVLVDLPGETDASEARSEIAHGFYNKLHRLMVVTPSDRAVDNKTAADFIRDEHMCDLEADGKMDGEFLAVVISKIDLLQWREFATHETDPSTIAEEFPIMLETYQNQESQLEELEEEFQHVREQIVQHSDDAADWKAAEAQLLKKHNGLKLDMKALDEKCLRACIDYRSRDTKEAFSQFIDEARNKFRGGKVKSNIEVLPVSSQAQRKLLQGNPMAGFANSKDTGFDALDRWIIKSSFSKREEHADNILHRCLVLFDAIEGCINDKAVSMPKLSKFELNEILKSISDLREVAARRCEADVQNFGRWFGRQDVFKRKGRSQQRQQKLVDAMRSTIRGFRQSQEIGRPHLHWATFHACLRRNGGPFKTNSKPPRIHDWNSRVYANYWSRAFEDWSKTFADALPSYTHLLIGTARARAAGCERALCLSERFPKEFQEAFKQSAYRTEHYYRHYRSEVQTMVNRCREQANSTRQITRATMKLSLLPFFEAAQREHGRGKYMRQLKKLDAFADNESERIVNTEIASKISTALSSIKRGTVKKYRTINEKLMQRLFKLAQDVAQEVCSASEEGHKSGPSNQMLKIQLMHDFQRWNEYWEWLKSQIPESSPHLPPESFDESLKTGENVDGATGIKAEESEDENIRSEAEHTVAAKTVKKKSSSTQKRAAPQPKAPRAPKRARKSKPMLMSSSKTSAAQRAAPADHSRSPCEPDQAQTTRASDDE